MTRNGRLTRKERDNQGDILLGAFRELYDLSEDQVKGYTLNFHNAKEPFGVRRRLHEALAPVKIPFLRKLDSLEQSVTHLGRLMERVPQSSECDGVFLFNYDEDNNLSDIGVKSPKFEDYVRALENNGAWPNGRPSDEEIRSWETFKTLVSLATYFPKQFETFVDTKGYKHITDFSRVLRCLANSEREKNPSQGWEVPLQRMCFEVLTYDLDPSKRRDPKTRTNLEFREVELLLNDPSKLRERLNGDETIEGIIQDVMPYQELDHRLDLDVLERIPYLKKHGKEHVREVAPKLKVLKGKETGSKRAKPLKTLLGLMDATDPEQRSDLLDIVERARSAQGVDSLNLYCRLRKNGLRPEEFVEFLRAGDQFDWKTEGRDTALSSVVSGGYLHMDPISAYLTLALSNFDVLQTLDNITTNRSSTPAAKELILNPSLLFLDDNAVELMTLARDYDHGRLIIERYATVKAEGLDERAEAVLHVGKLRPSRTDLKFIRERMRSLGEHELSNVMGCTSPEKLKDLLKSKEKKTSQKPIRTEGISWFDLMKKRMAKRGSSDEFIAEVEEAHRTLSDSEGNPRLLRNMFRTQPRNLGDLCRHVKENQGNETFELMMQRDSLFQRYKLGLVAVEDFNERFSEFLSEEHSNPFQALQDYLPCFEDCGVGLDKISPAEVCYQELPPLAESSGRIFLCGGIFRGEAKARLESEFPNLSIIRGRKSSRVVGLGKLSKNDTVVWIRQHSGHSPYDSVKDKCSRTGAKFLEIESDGLSSVRRFLSEPIKQRSHSKESAS